MPGAPDGDDLLVAPGRGGASTGGGAVMDFDALLAQVRELLQRQERVSYRALRLRFQLDDESLAALKDELIYAACVARDEEDRVLVWVGEAGTPSAPAAQSSPPLPP